MAPALSIDNQELKMGSRTVGEPLIKVLTGSGEKNFIIVLHFKTWIQFVTWKGVSVRYNYNDDERKP